MTSSVASCEYCERDAEPGEDVCEYHKFALFQVAEILREFVKVESPPDWLLAGIRELAWVYYGHPQTAAFINAAMEVADRFVIERASSLDINDIKEVNYTLLPQARVISILEKAYILKEDKGKFRPGPLVKRLIKVRNLNLPLESPEQEKAALEYQGILAVSLMRSMLEDGTVVPRGALAIMTFLAAQALRADGAIGPKVEQLTWDLAFNHVPRRQEDKMRRVMSGWLDGVAKVISDIDETGQPVLKEPIVVYLENMRERYRERERGRERR